MKILIFLLTMTSGLAFAGSGDTAYDMFCKDLTFQSSRDDCAKIIRPHSYYDDTALAICKKFTFDSTKFECLAIIGDMRYFTHEIELCGKSSFQSTIFSCLKERGTTTSNGGSESTCLSNREILKYLENGLKELRSGDTGTVDKRLQYLIGVFNNSSCR